MNALRRILSIDLRSLALFRGVVAGVLLADLADRARDLTVHYTDAGVLPVAAFAESEAARWLPWLSLHAASGSRLWVAALFGVAALAAVALLLGWRTRTAVVVSWVLLLSVQHRNPVIVYGGDNALATMLFFALFLPLGARFSLDARAGRGAPSGAVRVFSWASAGLLVQIAAMHFFSAFHKHSPEWLAEGSAVSLALHADQIARPLGVWLRPHDGLLHALTWGTLVLEVAGPVLLFLPWAWPWLRLLAVASFAGLHLGIGLSMDLIHFSWLCAGTIGVFLPPEAWSRLGGRGAGAADPAAEAAVSRLPAAARAALAAALALVLFANVAGLREPWMRAVESRPVAGLLMTPFHLLRLGQRWAMFSPRPPHTTWYAVEGVLADGTRVDLRRDAPGRPSLAKPGRRADFHPSRRWERFFTNASRSPYVDAYRNLARYHCRRFARPGGAFGAPLAAVIVWERRERTSVPGERVLEPARRVARFSCAAAGPAPARGSAPGR